MSDPLRPGEESPIEEIPPDPDAEAIEPFGKDSPLAQQEFDLRKRDRLNLITLRTVAVLVLLILFGLTSLSTLALFFLKSFGISSLSDVALLELTGASIAQLAALLRSAFGSIFSRK